MIYPHQLYVSGNSIAQYLAESWDEIKKDPRGFVCMYEPPAPGAKYILGLDTAEGITGWHRGMISAEDRKRDNSAIEIFRVDGARELVFKKENGKKVPVIDVRTKEQQVRYKDVQVLEFAAPIDPVEAARLANILGRIYQGQDEDMCQIILESWPGCGMLAMQELLRIGYTNLWQWEYFADGPVEQTKWIGWRSTNRSQHLLWQRSRRHLMDRRAVLRSRALRLEYSTAVTDPVKMRAVAASGFHDDRMQAANMAMWAAHGWSYDVETVSAPVTNVPVIDYQRYAPTLGEDYMTFQDWCADRVAAMED